ncbi:MAG: hypothetical protein ABW175_25590 [Bradyrhizobium sp.]
MADERVERRLAADVVGYSRLMGADEVGTLEALKAARSQIVDPSEQRRLLLRQARQASRSA